MDDSIMMSQKNRQNKALPCSMAHAVDTDFAKVERVTEVGVCASLVTVPTSKVGVSQHKCILSHSCEDTRFALESDQHSL
eukprot:4257738-Amphidinium_carterae.1